ncbi:MAG: hypothetical protein COA66_13855 [Arcobacter sp.]|nr:MAG: hypothetical protein COA66_13855 [Arcobacter sp.]
MKLINYALQNQIEYLGEDKTNTHFKDYIQNILEDTSKPYHQRCDYVGLSLSELKLKIDILSKDIQDLQSLKKKLTSSLELAKELTADVFIKNGIDRMDGTIISSLTLTKQSSKSKQTIKINNPNEVMSLGYVKFEPDVEAIEKALKTKEGLKELTDLVSTTETIVTTPAKVKINAKRISSDSTKETNEILSIEQTAA